jgi:hypothetical protein
LIKSHFTRHCEVMYQGAVSASTCCDLKTVAIGQNTIPGPVWVKDEGGTAEISRQPAANRRNDYTWDAANRLIENATGNLQLTPQYGNPLFQSPKLSASQPYNWEIIPKVVY